MSQGSESTALNPVKRYEERPCAEQAESGREGLRPSPIVIPHSSPIEDVTKVDESYRPDAAIGSYSPTYISDSAGGIDPGSPDSEVLLQEFNSRMNRSITLPPSERAKGMNAYREIPALVTEEMAKMENYYVSISDPYTSTFLPPTDSGNGRHAYDIHPSLLKAYRIIRHLYVQAALVLCYVIGFILVMVQMFGKRGSSCAFTFLCTAAYASELGVLFAFQGRSRLYYETYWRIAELIVLGFVLLFEFIALIVWYVHGPSGGFTTLCVFRFLLWILLGGTRYKQFQSGLRSFCSEGRRRYEAEGVDLDYAYIHRHIAAMGWPATNFECWFRNPMSEVSAFLANKHPGSCLVINICSERTYSPAYFQQMVSWYPMDDHNPAELEMMVTFCREVSDYVSVDPYTRVVAVHCKGGKGRTGTLICAYLMFSGLKRTAADALHHFAALRTKANFHKFHGVQTPSQDRYVHYFDLLLRESKRLFIPSVPMRIVGFSLRSIPPSWYVTSEADDMPTKLWFAVITRPCTERKVVYQSNRGVNFSSRLPDPSSYTAKQFRDLLGDESSFYKSTQRIGKVIRRTRAAHDDTAAAYTSGQAADEEELFPVDPDAFWFTVAHKHARTEAAKMTYTEFKAYLRTNPPPALPTKDHKATSASVLGSEDYSVSVEYRRADDMPVVDGDVVFKIYIAINDPNPLEPPVQFWLHTGMEAIKDSRDRKPNKRLELTFPRSQLDGPSKDKKFKKYPEDFSATVLLERQ